MKKADNGNRTRLSSLGSWRSTDELYLHTCIIEEPEHLQACTSLRVFLRDIHMCEPRHRRYGRNRTPPGTDALKIL